MQESAHFQSIVFDSIYINIIKGTMRGNNAQESLPPSICNCQKASWRGEGEIR